MTVVPIAGARAVLLSRGALETRDRFGLTWGRISFVHISIAKSASTCTKHVIRSLVKPTAHLNSFVCPKTTFGDLVLKDCVRCFQSFFLGKAEIALLVDFAISRTTVTIVLADAFPRTRKALGSDSGECSWKRPKILLNFTSCMPPGLCYVFQPILGLLCMRGGQNVKHQNITMNVSDMFLFTARNAELWDWKLVVRYLRCFLLR